MRVSAVGTLYLRAPVCCHLSGASKSGRQYGLLFQIIENGFSVIVLALPGHPRSFVLR